MYPPDIHECCDGRDDEPFDSDRPVVLSAHQRESTDHERGGDAGECSDRTVSMGRVLGDHTDIERHGDEDETGQDRGGASDHDEEVVPLIRPIDVKRNHHSSCVIVRPRRRSRTSGFTTLVGDPAAYALIWSKTSENWISHSSCET